MKITKKVLMFLIVSVLSMGLVACGNKGEGSAKANNINVITREDGSGTRSAFTEITGILEKDGDKEVDNTYEEAVVQNSTDAVMSSVAGDENTVGYISLGSLNDTVKALKVDGVEANAENIKNGSYKISRAFNIVYNDNISEDVLDFLKFIESDLGQEIVQEEGYVPELAGKTYEKTDNKSSITIAGSTSVAPLMEKLVEGYQKYNPEFNADIQATGSSAGIKSAMDSSAELGMSSRELKDNEKNLNVDVIARDGIAVIVNNDSKVEDLSLENIKNIFTGKIISWDEI